ncbi:MAG: diacylglycerol kinase family lipid kinase [Clostridia bacterium]|nr:diacylglycerol kinase family lipid kinase [Clostridia bacterium]
MYHMIINPKAGDKKVRRMLNTIKRCFEEAGEEYQIHETTRAGEGKEIAVELTKEEGVKLIAVGGDGSVHDVLNGIRDVEKCDFGIIPLGTGNDFVVSAGIPYDIKKAVEIILHGECKPTDYLEVNGIRCMNVAGIGIDVDVLERCNQGKGRGKLKYLKSLIVSLFKFHGYDTTVECEGETFQIKTLIGAACNGRLFGGGIEICPVAKLDDGKLDVMVVECFKSKWSIIKAFMMLMSGKIMKYKPKRYFKADCVKIVPEKPCTMQLDGELYYNQSVFEAKVCKGLRLYRP